MLVFVVVVIVVVGGGDDVVVVVVVRVVDVVAVGCVFFFVSCWRFLYQISVFHFPVLGFH